MVGFPTPLIFQGFQGIKDQPHVLAKRPCCRWSPGSSMEWRRWWCTCIQDPQGHILRGLTTHPTVINWDDTGMDGNYNSNGFSVDFHDIHTNFITISSSITASASNLSLNLSNFWHPKSHTIPTERTCSPPRSRRGFHWSHSPNMSKRWWDFLEVSGHVKKGHQ